MPSASTLAIAVAVALRLGMAAADIDMEACTRDTFLIYNQSIVARAAQTFFESLNVTFVASASSLRGSGEHGGGLPQAQPGHGRRLSHVQEATLSGVSVSSDQRKAFYDACATINAGWCPQVNVTAAWEDRQGTSVLLNAIFGMCFPYSCCDGSGCDMSGGLAAVASLGTSGTIFRWCRGGSNSTDGPLCPNVTSSDDQAAPLSGAFAASGAAARAASGSLLGEFGSRALAALAAPASAAAGAARSDAPASQGAAHPLLGVSKGSLALWGGKTNLAIAVSNFCLASVFDTFMYVAMGSAIVLCLCGCVIVAQRVCIMRRLAAAGLDIGPLDAYDGMPDGDREERRRRAEVRKRALRTLAFPLGSRPLTGGDAEARSPSSAPAPKTGRTSEAAESLLSGGGGGSGDDGGGDDDVGGEARAHRATLSRAATAPGASVGTAEEVVDPITLEPIAAGTMVVEFPSCGHVFQEDSLAQWLQSHDTCPVCRRPFPRDLLVGGPRAGGPEADAKVGAV
ncbi:hypothetical protein FNF29_05666 [Cafeteria roenbergensis]|nr:hypothetical protein FNF29_05666 [Cafeteria roenbergensis]KAA0156963.1 hypothetical protein FNF31_05798 [Cafeteria roenbergensis]|eukprot:KAA0149841.1 hypothetical protein FNF29_05666 [Cafeteria roenbergensis]